MSAQQPTSGFVSMGFVCLLVASGKALKPLTTATLDVGDKTNSFLGGAELRGIDRLKAGICDQRRECSLCLHGALALCSRCHPAGVDKSLTLRSQGGAQCVSPKCKCPENSLEPLAASEAIAFLFL